jgi:predicted DCC family thiol-disulfide oxidoreductase YuxK
MPESSAKKKITAYYDGKCTMCTASMNAVDRSSRSDLFDLRDMHRERSLPFSRDAVEKEIHVVDDAGAVFKGAVAILKILEQFPRFRVIAAIGQTAPVKPLLPFGYRFVARNRRFLFGEASPIYWLKLLVTVMFIVGLLMSTPLWIGPRTYPLAPVLAGLPTSIQPYDTFLFAVLLGSAAAIIVSSKPQKFIGLFLAVMMVYCALDQTRWQPWVFQYSFVLAGLALFSWDSDDVNGRIRVLNVARLIIATTYLFSGLQKINLNFMQVEFPWVVQPLTNLFPDAAYALHMFGFAAPFIQVGFAIGLLTRRFRRISLYLAIGMHVFILAMFGPFGHNWNSIIWPWTAAMVALDILLFGGRQEFSLSNIILPSRSIYHAVTLVLFGILPVLSFFNSWDSYLSAALYSGNITEAHIYTTDRGKAALPAKLARYAVRTSDNTNVINLAQWAIEDLHVMAYPETRVFKAAARSLCARLSDPSELVLIVREQRLLRSVPETGYRCWEL